MDGSWTRAVAPRRWAAAVMLSAAGLGSLAGLARADVVTPHAVKPTTVTPTVAKGPSASPSQGSTPTPSAGPAPGPAPAPQNGAQTSAPASAPPAPPRTGSGPAGGIGSRYDPLNPPFPADQPHFSDPDCDLDCKQAWFPWIWAQATQAWIDYRNGEGSQGDRDALAEEVGELEQDIIAMGAIPAAMPVGSTAGGGGDAGGLVGPPAPPRSASQSPASSGGSSPTKRPGASSASGGGTAPGKSEQAQGSGEPDPTQDPNYGWGLGEGWDLATPVEEAMDALDIAYEAVFGHPLFSCAFPKLQDDGSTYCPQ